jgi:phospholipid N-methyltransferase
MSAPVEPAPATFAIQTDPRGKAERFTVPPQSTSLSQQLLLFSRNFIKHPRMLGSLIPSSRFLVNHVLAEVDWNRARVFLEYGPGVGTFTAEILRRLRPDAVLIVLETNTDFVRFLRRRFKDDRLHVIHRSAADADTALSGLGLEHADYVLSGIPYTTMPPELRETILQKTHSVLHPNGAFLVYQFTRSVLPYLQGVFRLVDQDFEPLNVMPARLYYCRHQVENGNGQRSNGSGLPLSHQPVAPEPIGHARPPRSPG